MPPLWLIVGTAIAIGLTSAIDRMILKPRGTTVIVDGRTVPVRRKRDGQLLMAFMSATIIVLFVLGFALFEEANLTFLLLLAIPFTAIAGWSFWRALREDDRLPTETEARAGSMRVMRSTATPGKLLPWLPYKSYWVR